MKKAAMTFSLLGVAALMLGEDPGSPSGNSTESREPHQMLHRMWLKKDSSVQSEKEIIQKNLILFDFKTQA